MMRLVGEISGAELFLVFSLFMLAMKVDRPGGAGYRSTIKTQAERLLIPYLVWSAFFLAFRFVKADAFGYTANLANELMNWERWPGYILTGSAQYHLHFLPTLFFIGTVLSGAAGSDPVSVDRAVARSLVVFHGYGAGADMGLIPDPVLADFLSRIVRDVCYVGYGFAAFSLFGIWRRGITPTDAKLLCRASICFAAIAFMTTLAYGASAVASGMWTNRPGASFYAHLYMPALIFTVFLTAQNVKWSPVFGQLAKLNFGIYLIHPIFIDFFEIGTTKLGWHFDPATLVLSKYVFAVTCAFAATFLISKFRPLSWTIGQSHGSRRHGLYLEPTRPIRRDKNKLQQSPTAQHAPEVGASAASAR